MNSDSLYHICSQITDYQTFFNFSLLSKETLLISREFAESKKKEFSRKIIEGSEVYFRLPNKRKHGISIYSRTLRIFQNINNTTITLRDKLTYYNGILHGNFTEVYLLNLKSVLNPEGFFSIRENNGCPSYSINGNYANGRKEGLVSKQLLNVYGDILSENGTIIFYIRGVKVIEIYPESVAYLTFYENTLWKEIEGLEKYHMRKSVNRKVHKVVLSENETLEIIYFLIEKDKIARGISRH